MNSRSFPQAIVEWEGACLLDEAKHTSEMEAAMDATMPMARKRLPSVCDWNDDEDIPSNCWAPAVPEKEAQAEVL